MVVVNPQWISCNNFYFLCTNMLIIMVQNNLKLHIFQLKNVNVLFRADSQTLFHYCCSPAPNLLLLHWHLLASKWCCTTVLILRCLLLVCSPSWWRLFFRHLTVLEIVPCKQAQWILRPGRKEKNEWAERCLPLLMLLKSRAPCDYVNLNSCDETVIAHSIKAWWRSLHLRDNV